MSGVKHTLNVGLNRLLRRLAPTRDGERGQFLIILAFASVGLLVAVGMALDGGFAFARKAQLDRATDAAALAGVRKLTDPTITNPTTALRAANVRGRQLLAANGIITNADAIDTSSAGDCSSVVWVDSNPPGTIDYCGSRPPAELPGATRYHIEVHWYSETFFMNLIGIRRIPLRSVATAEYYDLVDLFSSPTAENGLVRSVNQSIFGPSGCYGYGDPYTPIDSPYYTVLNGAYTFRIVIPASYQTPTSSGGLGYDKVRVEIFDPDTGSQVHNPANNYTFYNQNGRARPGRCEDKIPGAPDDPRNNIRVNACLIDTGQGVDSNPFWFIRVDEPRGRTAAAPSGSCVDAYSNPGALTGYTDPRIINTRTVYRLFYYQQGPGGGLQQVDLAYYVGKADRSTPAQVPLGGGSYAINPQVEAQNTDLMWVSPGVPPSERMPAFTEIVTGIPTPDLPGSGFTLAAEPATQVENCNNARNYLRSNGYDDVIYATNCSPATNGDFIIDLNTEVPGIYVEPGTRTRYIYLQIIGLDGTSENGFEIWAGPPISEEPTARVPANVNARQVYVLNELRAGNDPHNSGGIAIYGMGHLNMNYNIAGRTQFPLAYLGPSFGGATITVNLFDPDEGRGPLVFYFDTIPEEDWIACYDEPGAPAGERCDAATLGFTPSTRSIISHTLPDIGPGTNRRWVTFTFDLPTEAINIPFYGGRLMADYHGGINDTIDWTIVIESRPYLIE